MGVMKNNLKSLFTGHWTYLAVSTACKLNLFDYLEEKKTVRQLAIELSLNEDKLLLLLTALFNASYLNKIGEYFQVNSLSKLLTDSNPDSLKYACLNWCGEHLTAWQNLEYSIKTGNSSFEAVYGKPFFDYLNDFPEKLHAYHNAMYQYARDDYKSLSDLIDFSNHKSIMDVGGGYGAILENIKGKYSSVDCVLFDLPKVIENVTNPNIKIIDGNFFELIPRESDAIILSRVLHDWNDDKSNLILKNCYEALPPSGILYVVENCTDKIQMDLSLLSLNMTVMCESYERTSSQYISLCEMAHFQFLNEYKLNELQTILIFKK